MQFLDALDGLIEIEPLFSRRTFCVRPDQLALFSVELHVLQQIPEHIVYLHALLALTRTHPLKKSVAKRVVAEDTVWWLFATLLAHEVVDRFGPSRPVLYWRGGACSRISMVPARRRNTRGLRFPQRSASRLNRIMSPIMVNEL